MGWPSPAKGWAGASLAAKGSQTQPSSQRLLGWPHGTLAGTLAAPTHPYPYPVPYHMATPPPHTRYPYPIPMPAYPPHWPSCRQRQRQNQASPRARGLLVLGHICTSGIADMAKRPGPLALAI